MSRPALGPGRSFVWVTLVRDAVPFRENKPHPTEFFHRNIRKNEWERNHPPSDAVRLILSAQTLQL